MSPRHHNRRGVVHGFHRNRKQLSPPIPLMLLVRTRSVRRSPGPSAGSRTVRRWRDGWRTVAPSRQDLAISLEIQRASRNWPCWGPTPLRQQWGPLGGSGPVRGRLETRLSELSTSWGRTRPTGVVLVSVSGAAAAPAAAAPGATAAAAAAGRSRDTCRAGRKSVSRRGVRRPSWEL